MARVAPASQDRGSLQDLPSYPVETPSLDDDTAAPPRHTQGGGVAKTKSTRSNLHRSRTVEVRSETTCALLLYRLITAPSFDMVMGTVVVANALCMVFESESDGTLQGTYKVLDYVFLGVFTAELVVRLYVFHHSMLLNWWMLLDTVIVAIGWLSVIVTTVASGMEVDLGTLQTLKVLRVLRCVRVLRMITIFKDLWLVVQTFFCCLRPLLWTSAFVVIVIFVFANFAISLIGRNPSFEDIPSARRFETILPAMLTLIQIMTLDEWMGVTGPLFARESWTYAFFFLYVGVSSLALMNLVTAIVVESSVKKTQADAAYQDLKFEAEMTKMQAQMDDIFASDCDDTMLTEHDFLVKACESQLLASLLSALNITTEGDLKDLFCILDVRNAGALSVRDLMVGIRQLQRLTQQKTVVALMRAQEDHEFKMMYLRKVMDQAPEANMERLANIERSLQSIAKSRELELQRALFNGEEVCNLEDQVAHLRHELGKRDAKLQGLVQDILDIQEGGSALIS